MHKGRAMRRISATLLLLLAAPAFAQTSEVNDAITKFVGAPGFERLDPVTTEQDLNAFWLDLETISPGGPIGPIEKALLTATSAIPSTRTRTAISYGEMVDEEAGPISFIELRHYNLGPQIRNDAIDAYGAENVGTPDDFGTGDHMAWRFVFMPLMNNAAIVRDVSNRTISPDDAADDECTGRPCLDPYASFEDMADWQEMGGTLPDWPAQYPDAVDGLSTPAHTIAELAVMGFWASAESGTYQWTGGEHPEAARNFQPYRFIGIDRDLGQEAMIDSVWRETLVNDDALSEILFRRLEIAGQVYLMQAGVER